MIITGFWECRRNKQKLIVIDLHGYGRRRLNGKSGSKKISLIRLKKQLKLLFGILIPLCNKPAEAIKQFVFWCEFYGKRKR